MDRFIGHRFGIPVSYSSKYNREPYTAGDMRLVHEDEEFFVVMNKLGTTFKRDKKHYNYKVIDETGEYE